MGRDLTCAAVDEEGWVERYLARKLTEAEVEAYETHYLSCARCQAELRLAMAIRGELARDGGG